MPTYEYACRQCGRHTEAVQSFTDDALTVCPHCGGNLRKVFGNIGIAFKGSGFYKNDSRPSTAASSSSGSSSTPDSGASAASPDGGSGGSTPAKADAPAPTPSTPASPPSSGSKDTSTSKPATTAS